MSKFMSKQRLATARATRTSLLSGHLLDHIDAQAERIETLLDFIAESRHCFNPGRQWMVDELFATLAKEQG